jgi:Dolichyl-phosphate-mannose-protein mannosyltransferase
VGLRAIGHGVVSSRDAATESFTISRTLAVTILLGLATFVIHIARAGEYGYQRDELYFISCARHLAWGYVDQPPLIALIAKISLALFGDSLYGIRLLPAVAAAAIVVLTGRLARRLGGGLAAQILAMLGIALAPFYLAVGSLLTMNAFEPLLWIGAAYLFVKANEDDTLQAWGALGLVCGLGLIDKYSMFLFLGSSVVAIALTPSRRALSRPGVALAALIALAIVAPTLVWQAQHGWPQLELLHAAAAAKNVAPGPLDFFAQEILMMGPLTAPLWIAGLVSLIRGNSALRWYGFAYVILTIVYLALGAKVYYLAPIYPVLFAAGSVSVAAFAERRPFLQFGYPALLLVAGIAIAPEAYPLLPLPAFLQYQRIFDVRGIKMEKHPEGVVPQHFADMLGWDTLVQTLARADATLTPSEQRDAVILTRDYGQASAVDFLGSRYGLPRAISGHNNYYLYGTRGASGNLVLSVGISESQLRGEFARIRRVGLYHDAYVLPDFNDLPIYACSKPIRPLAVWWPAMKRFI